ncbi:hypothetical protein BGZ47_007549 [Haplosporangium gracile]|nr:hypothetical protein BGZ47_007549 [Haplosporangium gracile]
MPPPHSPLEIPEILEQILSYVDESTIEQSVSRVNRTWFLLTRHRINQELVFDTNRRRGDFNTVMARLPEATRLWWHAENGRDRINQWRKLVRLLKIKDLRYRESKGGTTTVAVASQQGPGAGIGIGTGTVTVGPAGSKIKEEREYGYRDHDLLRSSTFNKNVAWTMQERPLLELRLSGFLNLYLRFPPLLPYLEFLTVLKLTMRMETDIHLQAILTRCGSCLQVLHVRTTSTLRLIGPWIPKRFPTPPFVEPYHWMQGDNSSQEQESPNILALRELVLERAYFFQTSLEALLCFTPHLDTLHLIELNRHSWMYLNLLEYDQRRLIRFLRDPHFPQKQILPLRSYTFSVSSTAFVTSTAAAIANVEQEIKHAQSELCPDSKEWTFFTEDLSLPLLKFLKEDVQNVVTTLELRNNNLHKFSLDPVLHRYLCASPHLLHLRAENTFYLVELLDIHGRMEMVNSRITSQDGVATTPTPTGGRGATGGGGAFNSLMGPPGIWACKNLQTLYISLRSASNTGSSTYATATPTPSTNPSSVTTTPKISCRIVFGYISRVCPYLRDLKIRFAENLYWAAWIPFGSRGSMTTRQRLSLTLDSGLCLLARLRHLEQLSIGFISGSGTSSSFLRRNMVWGLEPVDLEWMLERDGRRGSDERRKSRDRRMARRRVVEERWETWLAEEKVVLLQKAMDTSWWISRTRKTVDHVTVTTATTNGNNNNKNRSPIRGRTDPEIHEQLKDLGLLVDVKNMLEEMNIADEQEGESGGGGGGGKEGYKYWPMLRWMRIYHSTEYGRSREREVKRILTAFAGKVQG